MNIHFKDKNYFEILKSAALLKIEVGSSMYSLNDEYSDVDYLYILPNSEFDEYSLINSHHQLQFKEDNIDHNFTNIRNFLNNSLKGESSINFECINSDKLKGTCLEFLYNNKSCFNNYNIIRGYLGFARRDFKFYFRESTERDRKKKLIHIWRGYFFAKSLLNNDFSLINKELLEKASEIRSIKFDMNRTKELDNSARSAMLLISGLRDELNNLLNSKSITKIMNVSNQTSLNCCLKDLYNSDEYKYKKSLIIETDDIKAEIFNVNENWVSYE